MDTDEESSSLSLSSETKTCCVEGITLCIVVGLPPLLILLQNPSKNGVYPDFQTIQPPGYLKRVKARVDGEGQKTEMPAC
jgi:hypothetical protein